MKKILLLLLILPVLAFAQTERSQKLQFRNGSSYNSRPQYSAPQQLPSRQQPRIDNSEYQQKQNFRSERNYQQHNSNHYNYYPYPYYYDNWRYLRYGYPSYWGYDYYSPYYYYDRWGYRQPARIYYYDGGKSSDTIKTTKTRTSIGIQKVKNQIGAFITIGKDVYFIAEYQQSYKRDESMYYSDITTDNVRCWNDQKLEDINNNGTFYVGLGKRIGRYGVHAEVGFNKDVSRYQYFDETFILSNNGLYSFPKYSTKYNSLKVGAIYDYKISTLKLDYDLTKNVFTIGGGFNF